MKLGAFGEDGEGHELEHIQANFQQKNRKWF